MGNTFFFNDMAADFVLSVNLVDIPARTVGPATLRVMAGRITAIELVAGASGPDPAAASGS